MNYKPLEEIKDLLIRKRILEQKYNITGEDIYKINYKISEIEREFNMRKHDMNEDLKKYPVYALTRSGELIQIFWIKTVDDYNHYYYNLHHYIKKQHYEDNKQWYDERGIKQKLIYMPIKIHEQLHGQAIKNLTDEQFKATFNISKWALFFNKKYSRY